MVDYKYGSLFLQDSTDKQLNIATDDKSVVITNADLPEGEFELSEALCSEDKLQFGSCEASIVKFRVYNALASLKDKWLNVTCTLDGNVDAPFHFGRYKVFSDVPTADRKFKDIVAYDAMYDIINSNVADWYNGLLPDKTSAVTMKQFRTSFAAHFGLEQEDITLVNDSMTVEKTIEPSELSGKDVITAICEINGCFGHIGRDEKLCYIYLKELVEGLYPSNTLYPADDLFPADPLNSTRISKSRYVFCKYEDFKTKRIDKLQIRQEENDVGCVYGDGENCYIIQGNFLVYGKSADELNTAAENLYPVMRKVCYRPAAVEASGNPCLEAGDGIRLVTKREIIYTYILRRTLKGIQALRDTYESDGVEQYSGNVNSVAQSILQLKGKTNTLTRTVEETRSELVDLEEGTETRFVQTAEAITAEAKRAGEAEAALSIRADEIKQSVTDLNENTSATFRVLSDRISSKVSQGDISSEISQEAGKIELRGNRVVIESTYFMLDEEGHILLLGDGTFAEMKPYEFYIRNESDRYGLSLGPSMIGFTPRTTGSGILGMMTVNDELYIGDYSRTTHVYCTYINGGTPVTDRNIAQLEYTAALESRIAGLEEKIKALEAKVDGLIQK